MKIYKQGRYFIIVFDDEVCAYVGYGDQRPYQGESEEILRHYMKKDADALASEAWGPPIYTD